MLSLLGISSPTMQLIIYLQRRLVIHGGREAYVTNGAVEGRLASKRSSSKAITCSRGQTEVSGLLGFLRPSASDSARTTNYA